MEISAFVDEASGVDVTLLDSLRDWLKSESELRGRVQFRTPAIAPDAMGGLTDALIIAVGSGGTLTVLANSLAVWIAQQRSDVHIRLKNPESGVEVVVDATNVRDADALVRTTFESAAG